MRQRFYVGLRLAEMNGSNREVFKSDVPPTRDTHGHIYVEVIGPFQTKRGATFMALYGRGNPHVQRVADVERLAQVHATQHLLAEEAMAHLDKRRKDATNGKSRSG